MFIRLTSADNRTFLLNVTYIVEIIETDKDIDINSIIITPLKDSKNKERIYEVQETLDEIELKIKTIQKN